MTEDVKVSVICITYNHKDYIRDALEGFVSQKTNFKFEVLIHDDASTDGTADIIREYEAKYPELIRPVYQTENQYSQGVDFGRKYLYPMARGKYMAWCEGDDYWCDPYKLQKQYDYLEAHPECNICTCRAISVDSVTGNCPIIPAYLIDKLYTTEELIANGSNCFATATTFMRWDTFISLPACFVDPDCYYYIDWQLVIYGSVSGGCYCMHDIMAVYNYRHKGSFTENYTSNKMFRYKVNVSNLKIFEKINEYYDYKYDDVIQKLLTYYRYHIVKREGRLEDIQGEEYAGYRIKDEIRKKLKTI